MWPVSKVENILDASFGRYKQLPGACNLRKSLADSDCHLDVTFVENNRS